MTRVAWFEAVAGSSPVVEPRTQDLLLSELMRVEAAVWAGRRRYGLCAWLLLTTLLLAPVLLAAQSPAAVRGLVVDASTGEPVRSALIEVEGTELRVLSGPEGRFEIRGVPAGRQWIRASGVGYAPSRVSVAVPSSGSIEIDVPMAASALHVQGIVVTADPVGRARGELGTASVIEREAIRHQTATSLAGVLELLPGVPLRPPGLDGIQQFSLRSAPISGLGTEAVGPGSNDVASAGTLIVVDGVPLSNNANMQSLGPRGEIPFSSTAGGGVDLRRIPAALLDRVEIIRGIPSARYGDLSHGAVLVETRAGVVEPELGLRRDQQSAEVNVMGGWALTDAHTATASAGLAHTLLQPGVREDDALRATGQLAHRWVWESGWMLDSRIDAFQVLQDTPENSDLAPGRAARSRDRGIRAATRMRGALNESTRLEVSLSLDRQQQRSFTQALRLRGALPFTDRLEDGRSVGRFVGGEYRSRVDIDGDPWFVFGRVEGSWRGTRSGFDHFLRAGTEFRREWNTGPGYQFDIEFPPQSTFNGVQGFDRPRRYDDIPALSAGALYLDNRLLRELGGGVRVEGQAGVRLDFLNEGEHWFSGIRDLSVQPRFSLEVSPTAWMAVRAGAGRTAKLPTLGHLHPAPQVHDVVNVNWFANDPSERLAVLTTTFLETADPDLGLSTTDKLEAGIRLSSAAGGRWGLDVVAFSDVARGGLGLRRDVSWLARDHFQLTDSTAGTGRPPQVIEPAFRTDTVPVLVLVPSNVLEMRTSGYEGSLHLPPIDRIGTRLEVHGAWIKTRLHYDGIEVGTGFNAFQLDGSRERAPWWNGSTRTGERLILTGRIVHQQPEAGLVVTGTVQHVSHERRRSEAGTGPLDFAGYMTRTGEFVEVPRSQRDLPEYSDLQVPRGGISTATQTVEPDWLLSVQVSKSLPREGRLAFYAFNALDRVGRFVGPDRPGALPRTHPGMRFGLEVVLLPGALLR